MLKVKQGEIEKLGLLFERYHKMLYVFFYRMNQNQELSEDLVQEVFERVMKYKKSFKGDGSFKSWIFHIARNINYDHHKKNMKLPTQELSEDWDNKVTDHEANREEEKKERELMLLDESLKRLSVEKKELITLSKLKGMKYKEIGEMYNISEGTVKVRIFRALKDLQKQYTELESSIA